MKRIGILGGSSDQATADYYHRLNKEVNKSLGGWHTAELLVNSMDFAFSAECVRKRVTKSADVEVMPAQVIEKNGRPVRARTADLHRVKVAL